MKFNFKEWLNEGVTVSVADYHTDPKSKGEHPKDLHELAWRVMTDLQKVPGFKQANNAEILSPDGLDVTAKKGIINFYTQGIPPEALPKILSAIKYFIGEYGATSGQPTKDTSKLFGGEVYRIPAAVNMGTSDVPVKVDMAMGTAAVILGLLNIHDQMRIGARDMLMKIDMLNDFAIKNAVKEPERSKEPGKAQVHDFGVDEERIRRHLGNLAKMAKWAIDHHYDTLEFDSLPW